ncbi:hypothetical protein [uncultured Agrobacterium sp.]|uniref:hypothetical protein n=1 Tax=uncultured Agrobacterium sp. TaxID=157277 RepID=UPI0025D4083B|nr:hypothetical protein [uncultured Agrobacterium sp.]
MNQHLVINACTGYVINIIVGEVSLPGCTCVPRTPENRHVTVGWSLIDGAFADTRATYDPTRRWERSS